MLTKKDFEFLAETVQESWACQRIPLNKRGWLASRFADWIERRKPTNPRFDRAKFIQACGLSHQETDFPQMKHAERNPLRIKFPE